eukprot:comp19829_c1_seq1/m.23858 comp19829_c1_seq1/g.23858  ORF comp19829_c1_seq1/g.23858 comp19829_c1_seq1/m.23858 type:complete len:318 (-) comp19829_c1_seq1:243-1196(-)
MDTGRKAGDNGLYGLDVDSNTAATMLAGPSVPVRQPPFLPALQLVLVQLMTTSVLVVGVLGPVFAFVCANLGLISDINPSLFTGTIVFPLSFLISSSFSRRESVLNELAGIKQAMVGLHHLYLTFGQYAGEGWALPRHGSQLLFSVASLLALYLRTQDPPTRALQAKGLYSLISKVQGVSEGIRNSKFADRLALYNRMLNNVGTIMASIEKIRVVRENRTPRSIQAFLKISIFSLPILSAPYFAMLAGKWLPIFGYGSSLVFCLAFALLLSVFESLDDPFDNKGVDDIDLRNLASSWLDDSLLEMDRLQSESSKPTN